MSDLYERDFIGWAEQQARLLRQAAGAGSDLALDWANLIEEVEGLGRTQYLAAASQVRRIMTDLLKLEFAAAKESRLSWEDALDEGRADMARLLDYDPGLRPRLPAVIAAETPRAFKLAVGALETSGDDPAGILARQQQGTTLSVEELLGDWLPERPDPT